MRVRRIRNIVPKQEEVIVPEFREADLASANRTENDPSVQVFRDMIQMSPSARDNKQLSKLNNAVMFNPYLGDLLEKGRKAQITRTRNF